MSIETINQPYKQKRGSFFKLIDSLAWEIGTLKKEVGNNTETERGDLKTDTFLGLDDKVGGLFLQTSTCAEMGPTLAGARDSGYDSLHRPMSVLERLVNTHAVWLQLDLSHMEATNILQGQPTGTFLVRKSSSLQRKVISLRMDKDSSILVKDVPIMESQYTFSLEGSGLCFADLFHLVSFCCISRDVLPFTLKLPEAITSAQTPADLEEVAKRGAGFWNSQICKRRNGSLSLPGTTGPERPPPPAQKPVSLSTSPETHCVLTHTLSQLECGKSKGALWFINPLFMKVHQPESNLHTNPNSSTETFLDQVAHKNSSGPKNSSQPPLGDQVCGSSNDWMLDRRSPLDAQKQSVINVISRIPPARPPPPRILPQPSAPLPRQHSMPEKIPWISVPKEKVEPKERGSFLSRLGSSLSISTSSSPPKRFSISSPIFIPSLPITLSSVSSSPRWAKALPSATQEDAQCHLALEDHTIENALRRAKLHQENCTTSCQLTSSPPKSASKPEEGQGREKVAGVECSGGGQRLSDMSMSTDSSDSLDLSQSSAFFLPPMHEPSLPTMDDFNTHLPLSVPSSHLHYCSMEEDDDDEEDDVEEDVDYGVSLESDQELTMVAPGCSTRRRSSAGALVIQKAWQDLRKVSGVFHSLLTPEKRAIRKVVDMAKMRNSGFSSLVQDFISYMGEGEETQAWQGYASGLELLQTIRQFITQMKIYLRQCSEMDPPIESLIPEDQIDRVLEKAMYKCVLKPLKPVVSTALQEFQVRSGDWHELKDNLALAKARQPQEMGVADTQPPDAIAIEKIRHKFQSMCKHYSPEKKVAMLLRVCKLIYAVMEDNSGRLYGADDFLPMLTYVLAQCDMPQLENEILYMMELLDPALLHGEGGYYLTSAYGAMSLIRNFQEEQAARVLSSETRDTLHQWHRRRTTLRATPSIDDFQNYLRVALQEMNSGCTAKTLQVRPYTTVEEVCQLCAQKFKVSDPLNYGLFLLIEGSSQQLAMDTHPQKIKAELHSRPEAVTFHFVFRRVSNTSSSSDSSSELNKYSDPHSIFKDLPASSNQSILSPGLSLSLSPNHLNGNSISDSVVSNPLH